MQWFSLRTMLSDPRSQPPCTFPVHAVNEASAVVLTHGQLNQLKIMVLLALDNSNMT